LIVFYLFKKITFFILKRLENIFVKIKSESVNKALHKLSRPITLLIVFWLIEKMLPMLQLPLNFNTFLFLGLNIAKTVFWIYVFLKLVQVVMQIYADIASRTESKLDDQLVPILKNILQGLVIIVGIFNLLKLFGVNTTTLIAGFSIGGLAVALASQDTVKNLIGTFMIFLDQPFQIGDWIEAGTVVGTVEQVGFRSTQIRAADTSLFQIPKAHPDTRSDAFNVEFTGFGDSALLILINMYFTALGWNEEQSSKHRLHIAIVKLAKALGVDFAFPSTTVMIEQFPEKTGLDMKYSTDKKNIDNKIKNIIDEFNNSNN